MPSKNHHHHNSEDLESKNSLINHHSHDHSHDDHDEEEEAGEGLIGRLIKTKSVRLACMLAMVIMYFLAEIIVGKFVL